MSAPYKSQPVLYRAIAGDEYAAIITDVRDGVCSLTTFPPGLASTQISRCRYFDRKADAPETGAACYPAVTA
jgi:hypothetical protein